jgi:hypothetical protein
MTLALALLALIVLLHAADVATTLKGLGQGLSEANPLARALFGRFGAGPSAIILKIALTAPMALLCIRYPNWWPVPALYAASLAFIVWRNFRLLRGG